MEQRTEWANAESADNARNAGLLQILGLVWQFKWILALGLMVGLALGYLYFLRKTPVYRSTAQVLVVKKEVQLPVAGMEGQLGYEDTLSTHVLLLRSPLIVRQAVEKHHLASLSSLKGEEDPVGAIIEGLSASPTDKKSPGGQVIDLAYEGRDPEHCVIVLDAVIKSYEAFLGDTYQDFGEETVTLIGRAKDELDLKLAEKESEYREFREGSPLLWNGENGINFHEARMTSIESARSELLLEMTQIRSRIESTRKALAQGCPPDALTMLIESFRTLDRSQSSSWENMARDRMFEALLEEQVLLQDFGPDHPKVKIAHKRIELIQEYLGDTLLAEDVKNYTPAELLALLMETLRQELKMAEERLTELDTLFADEREAAKALTNFQLTEEAYQSEIDRMKQLFDGCVGRLGEINLVKDYNAVNTQVISPPARGKLVRPIFAIIMGMSGICGLMAGFGLGWLVDFADRRFRSPEEIRRQLGLPLVGHIPLLEARRGDPVRVNGNAAKARLDASLCTFHNPKGQQAEAFRAVRTSLYFSAGSEGHKVIQVTSPNPRDGKSTLAANLALSIAQSGKRVLLLEADFRRPRIHRLFGLKNTTGVTSVLTGDAELPDAAQETAVENLSVMTCGPRPQNASDLLTTPRFKELIDAVREKYDFVIVDTPPLLAVSDPAVVAPRIDAVLMVIRLTKHARDAAKRATEILESVGTKILGVVVNGIGKTSGYGYGGYGYKYGYKYGYGYRYGYGYGYGDQGSHYYSEAEAEKEAEAEASTSSPERKPSQTS